jgi:hypothetical protein
MQPNMECLPRVCYEWRRMQDEDMTLLGDAWFGFVKVREA